jgi:hypothetical protein
MLVVRQQWIVGAELFADIERATILLRIDWLSGLIGALLW